MVKFITAREAAEKIPDDCTLAAAGMGLSGWAEEIACAVRDRYRETGHPAGLTLRQGGAIGDWGFGTGFFGWDRSPRPEKDTAHGSRGVTRFGEAGPGLITKWVSGHIGSAFTLCEQVTKNQIACHCIPQGVAMNLWREIAAGRPGLITKVGLGTFVDPRQEGGRMNAAAEGNAAELLTLGGEEYLFYPAFRVDVALLRGTIADEKGNISFTHEGLLNEGLAVAQAAKNSGGIVIVQVEYLAKAETLPPNDVRIPGALVDYVVQARDPMSCWQAEGDYWEPSFSGQFRRPLSSIAPLPLTERKVICRRCAMELRPGALVNLGVGVPADVSKVVAEEGFLEKMTLSTECGIVGGVPSAHPSFGLAYNPEMIMTPNEMFDMLDGGCLDLTCLGIGEIDEEGNNNVSRMGKRLIGPGGFINITRATKKVVFAGTMLSHAKFRIGDGKLMILEEGDIQKLIPHVTQITFSGKYAPDDQEILYVTERAVFRLLHHRMTLCEVAPGIDVERDVLAHMGFRPDISPDLRLMDPGIFTEHWGGLGRYLGGQAQQGR